MPVQIAIIITETVGKVLDTKVQCTETNGTRNEKVFGREVLDAFELWYSKQRAIKRAEMDTEDPGKN